MLINSLTDIKTKTKKREKKFFFCVTNYRDAKIFAAVKLKSCFMSLF